MLAMLRNGISQVRCREFRMVLVALELLQLSDVCRESRPPEEHSTLTDQSPIKPPQYLNDHGRPHQHGICVDEPPLCLRCSSDPRSHELLQLNAKPAQAIKALQQPRQELTHISLDRSLEPEARSTTGYTRKQLQSSKTQHQSG